MQWPEHVDRWRLAYSIMVLQGLASAIPWNVYVTESEYFALRVHQPPTLQALADNFETVELLVSQAANVLGFLLYLPLQDALSMDFQVLHPQVLTLAVMVVAVVMTLAPGWSGSSVIWLSLISQAILGVTNATITGGIMAMASWLPTPYVQGMSLGIGMGCVGVALMSLLTLWATPRSSHVPTAADVAPAACAYFLGSCTVLALSIAAYLLFFYLPYVQHHSLPAGFTKASYEAPPKGQLAQSPFSQEEAQAAAEVQAGRASSSVPIPRTPSESGASRPGTQGTPTGASSLQQRRDSASFLRSKSFSERSRHGSFGSLERLAAFAQASPTAAALLAREPSLEAEACSMRAAALPMNEAVRQDSISSLATSPSMHGGQLLAAAGQPGTQLSSVVLVDDAPDMTQPLGATRVPLAADEKAPLLGRRGDTNEEGISISATLRLLFWWSMIAVVESTVTLTVFPGVTSAVCSEHNAATTAPCHPFSRRGRLYGDLFVPSVFVLFNACDLTGRIIAGLPPWNHKPPRMPLLVLYCLARVPLAGGLLLCKVVTASAWRLPVLFRSDWWPVGFTAAVGFTNGHLQSLIFMHSPQALPRRARDRCGPIINFALCIGCTIGSVVSFALIASLQQR